MRGSTSPRHPSDVLAGLVLGGLVAFVLYALARSVLTRLVTVARDTRLRPLLTTAPVPAGS